MTRVLVTGGTGCIGRHLLPLLAGRGWEVHAITSRLDPPAVEGVTWHRADLLQAGEAARIVPAIRADAIVHLAWFVAPGRWASAPENLDWVPASLALMRAFAEAGGRRVVVAGSGLEYDWTYGFCSEARTPCEPHTYYGTCKHALRLLLEGYARQTDLRVVWGRIFFLYGPHEHPERLVASVTRSLLAGERARCSHGRQIRDYLFAGDVAGALLALLESEIEGPVNVASGRPITVRELAEGVGRLLKSSDRIDFGAVPPAATDTPLVVADVARLQRDVGWRPSCGLEEGLAATIGWWREQMQTVGDRR